MKYELPTDKEALEAGCYYDQKYPDNVAGFAKDILGITLNPFQVHAVNMIYGWRRPTGKLRWRVASIWTPKKQGKSFLVSLLCIAQAYAKRDQQIYIIASTKEEGQTIWDEIVRLVSRKLKDRYWVREHASEIVDQQTGSVIHLLSGSPTGKSGWNADLLINDEIAWWEKAWADKVWAKTENSTMARDGLHITISTAAFDRSSLGYRQYSRAKAVLSGESQDWTLLPIIYEVPEDADWTDETNWIPALPALGHTVSLEYYRDKYRQIGDDVAAQAVFRCHLLNQWCGSPQGWLSPILWGACASNTPEDKLYGRKAIIGVDAARRFDNSVYVVIVEDDGKYHIYPRWFVPSDIATEKAERDHFDYRSTASKTKIHFTPGNTVDLSYMRKSILNDCKSFIIEGVYFDPYGFEETRQLLQQEGINCVEVTQNPKNLAPAILKAETLIKEGKLRHPNCPILNWNFENCIPKKDKDDRTDQLLKASDIQRIDGIDAIITGLCYWLEDRKPDPHQLPPGKSWVSVW